MADISQVKLPNGDIYNLVDETSGYVTTDTKDTAGSNQPVGIRMKLYLIGAGYQSAYAETYSYSDTYIDSDGSFHVNGALAIGNGDNSYCNVFAPIEVPTANRVYGLPNKAGTVALTSDIKDATLTIQKNGVNVQTFTANASSNKTANIVVNEVPSGGTTGQALVKNSTTNYDVSWANVTTTAARIIRWTESI